MQDKRSHDRYSIERDVVLACGEARHAGRTRDLSLGGIFVHTTAPLRFGVEVELHLSLPELKYEGRIPTIVRWVDNGGVGLAYRSLRARDVHALNQLFKKAGGL